MAEETYPTAVSSDKSPCFIRDNKLHLTPALFHELDAMAREAGHVCRVLEPDDMRGNFATIGHCGDLLFYRRLPDFERKGCARNYEHGPCGVIDLAQSIDLESFYSCWRPELDWSAIKVQDIYYFLVAHEIAHARCRDNGLFWFLNFGPMGKKGDPKVEAAFRRLEGNREAMHKMRLFTEARANREAWQTLYPDRPMPTRDDAMPATGLAEIHDEYRVILDRHESMKPLQPVALFPEYVLADHLQRGFLLWSREVCEIVLSAAKAAYVVLREAA